MPGAMKSIPPSRPTSIRSGQGGVEEQVETKVEAAFERNWGVVVWNDPVNTMSYVTFVFQKVLKMDLATAERHMLEVHHKGKSLVAHETRERAELLVHQMQGFGLKATLEPA